MKWAYRISWDISCWYDFWALLKSNFANFWKAKIHLFVAWNPKWVLINNLAKLLWKGLVKVSPTCLAIPFSRFLICVLKIWPQNSPIISSFSSPGKHSWQASYTLVNPSISSKTFLFNSPFLAVKLSNTSAPKRTYIQAHVVV